MNIASSNYSCEYRFKVADLKFRDSGDILIWLELTNQVEAYLYSGTDHKNLTTVIEANALATIGAPYRVKLSDGAVIVARSLVSSV